MSGRSLVQSLATSTEDLGDGSLVVKHDVGEVAINTIVDVNHVALAVQSGVLDGTASDDVACNSVGCGDVVATWLGDDLNIAVRGEKLVESVSEHGSHGLKSVSSEATANIEGSHVESNFVTLLEDRMGITHSLVKSQGIRSTRANVEAHTNNVETEVLGKGKETLGGVHSSSKLHAEAAKAFAVVGHDAEKELGAAVELGNLVKLIGVVKCHLLDTHRLDVSDVGVGLAGLSVDDAIGAEACRKDLFDLGLGGTIKTSAKLGEELNDLRVGVALDRCAYVNKQRREGRLGSRNLP